MTRSFALVACAAALSLGLAACGGNDNTTSSSTGGGAPSADLSGEIAGAGSSAQEAAQEAWIANFQDANPNVTIAYDPVGSGGGREQFIAGGVDYAGSDAPLSTDELPDAEKECGGADNLVQVPVYVSPIAIIYNLDGVDTLNLDADTIAQIFNQKITKWNDPAIAKLNPKADLPDTDITPVNRSDDSGTTFNFTDYLSKAAPDSWTYPADDTFPVKGGEAAEGTSGVVEAVGAGEGTIGYADASQAKNLGIANIAVGSKYIAPSADGAANDIQASKEDTKIGGDANVFAYDVERTSTDTANYPLTLPSYALACTNAKNADIVGPFLQYVISPEGQDAAAKNAGSAPITDQVRQQITPAVEAIGS